MKLSTTTCDLAAYYQDKSIAAPLKGMKATGFTHIDLSMSKILYKDSPWLTEDGWKKEVEDCISVANSEEFDLCQAHSPYINAFDNDERTQALVTALSNSIKACSMLGIKNTVVHPIALYGATPAQFTKKNIEYYKQFDELSQKENVNILMENSSSKWNPQCYIRTGKELSEFVELANIKNMYVCWDIGHGNVQGLNQYVELCNIGKKLKAIHIHDNYGNEDSHVMPLVGVTNFDDVMRGLIDIEYDGNFTFEACSTLRGANAWPNYRKNIKEDNILSNPPLFIQQKQQNVMYELGKWMLESYGIKPE